MVAGLIRFNAGYPLGGGGAAPPPPSGSWPGQAGNLVGYNRTPSTAPAAFTSANGKVWPGAYSSLTAWPGGTGLQTITSGVFATSGAGTATNPYVFAFYDFNSGTGGVSVQLNNCIFVGCRFQSNAAGNYNVETPNANISFIYCSFVPLVSFYTAPPGLVWPSAGTGANTTTQVTDVNAINGNTGYQVGISVPAGAGPITADHCDCWGMGNSFSQMGVTTAQLTYSDCWVHDAVNAAPQSYHQDGIGYVNGLGPPANITINHCTIASIGNTNALAFQSATGPYRNISITNCYLSGFGYMMDLGHDIAGNANWTFTDNTIATDIQWIFGPLGNSTTGSMFTQTNGLSNLWRRNTFKVNPGSTPAAGSFAWTSADNGKFFLPTNVTSATDWSA